jgi:carbamoyl-phosphate synthase large subunit
MPRRTDIESILLIGSGPIVIGQACEFDYAGCQALKVLREDGFRTVVVNSNPATIMTDPGFADRTYLEPLDLEGVRGVLERKTGRVLVTSQNHGFAVKATDAMEAPHISLYDGTVEGLDYTELRARSAQFHPEASPGPHDAAPIIARWVEEVSALAKAA